MSNNNSVAGAEDLVPELGDEIEIVARTGKIHGIIVYRSERLIRVRPFSSKTDVYEFPLDENGDYMEHLGVIETRLDAEKKAKDPHFSVQMEVSPGSKLEFYDREGKTLATKIVHSVIATDEYDGLKFTDGEVMDFGFMGLPEPYVSFLNVTGLEGEDVNLSNAEQEHEAAAASPDVLNTNEGADLIELLLQQQGEIRHDETAQINRPYPEVQQRQEMFVSVMQMIAPKVEQQKNPRILRKAYIETDLLASLKRSVVELSPQGLPLLNTSKSRRVNQLYDVLNHMYPPILMPIVDVKKVLATHEYDNDTDTVDYVSESTAVSAAKDTYDAFSKAINPPRRTDNAFETYMRGLDDAFHPYAAHPEADFQFTDDLEVYFGKPGEGVKGFKDLPEKYSVSLEDTREDIPAYPIRLVKQGNTFGDRIANKTIVLQNADTAKHAGYIFLSPELSYLRLPVRSSVLLWDIHASEWSRHNRYTLQSRLLEAKDNQIFGDDEQVTISILDVLRSRLQPSLSLMTWANVCVMDSIGLRALELTQEQMHVFHTKMVEGQTNWDTAMVKMKEDTVAHLTQESTFPVKPIVSMRDSNLFTDSVLADKTFAPFGERFKNKETLYKDYDIALMSAIMDESYSTLLPYWSALVANMSQEFIEHARHTYESEAARVVRKQETQREHGRRFVAAPVINKCPHVRDYEVVNKISNDSERMKALEGFVKKYNGGTQNNFVKCNICLQNLVCKHELLLLQEYKLQQQATSIHKQLVLEFGGPVFMGSYICKNCGQKISNLEFDTHLEFDDEGRPLVGRSVLQPDEGEGAAEGDDEATLADQSAKIDKITDFSQTMAKDFVLYQSMKRLFEEAHIVLPDDLAKTLLAELKIYLAKAVFNETTYTNIVLKKNPKLPPYAIYYNQNLIGVMAALAVIELQNLPTDIPIPNRQCPYSRAGFPMDYLDTIPTGEVNKDAIRYIACVVGLIRSSDAPWNSVLWADQSKPHDVRNKAIMDEIQKCLGLMRGTDPTFLIKKPDVPGITDEQTRRMRAAKALRIQTERTARAQFKPSDADRLPSHFHPCPVYEQTDPATAINVGNVANFETSVRTAALNEIKPVVAARLQQIQQDIMYQMNHDMETSVARRTYAFDAVNADGLGYRAAGLSDAARAEYMLMAKSYKDLDRRDPSRPNTGTHLYVPWVAPPSDIVEATPDESIYYKLFIKVCARGINKGAVHEFTYGNVCRHCEFKLQDALIYETNSEIPPSAKDVNAQLAAQAERRKAAVEDSCRAIGVEISAYTFNELRAEINLRKQVPARRFETNYSVLERISGLGQFLHESSKHTLAQLVQGMEDIYGDGSRPPLFGDARYEPLSPFYAALDAVKAQILGNLVRSLPDSMLQTVREKQVKEKLVRLETIVGNVRGDECLRSLKRMFVFSSKFIRDNTITPSVPLQRWIPNIFSGHKDALMKQLSQLNSAVKESLDEFTETYAHEDETGDRNALYDVLNTISLRIGQLLRYWQSYIRLNQVFVIQENMNEYSKVLLWCVYSIINDAFAFLDMDWAARGYLKPFLGKWILRSIDAEHDTYALYRKTPEEIKASMNDRREREKAHKIAQQDREADPEIRRLMRTALKLGYSQDAILRRTGYNAEAESLRFLELQALGLTGDREGRGPAVHPEEGMGHIADEDGDV
jgi:hypothetical protein